jgi:hypothetical protein
MMRKVYCLITIIGLLFTTHTAVIAQNELFPKLKGQLTPLRDNDTGKYGYVNARGDWVVLPQFDVAGGFELNEATYAVVKYKKKWGCINAQGKWVVKPVFYDNILGESDARAAGASLADGEPVGKKLFKMQDKESEKWGYVNARGNWAILPVYDDLYSKPTGQEFFSEGSDYFEVVKYKGKYGCINKKGEWIVKPIHASDILGVENARRAGETIASTEDLSIPASQVANYHDKPTNGFQWEGVVEQISQIANNPIIDNAGNPVTSTQTPPAQTTAAVGVKPPLLTIVSSPPHYDGDRVIIRYEAKTSDGLPALINISVDGAPLDANNLSLGAKGVRRASDELEIPLPAKGGTRNIALVAVDEKNGLHSATQYIALPFRGEEFKPVLHTLAIGVGKYAKKNITELKYADKDAIDFANTIKGISTNQYREIKDPIVMTNEQADYLSIKKALGNIVKNAKQEDVVILFFSGHGEQDMGNTYYLSHDANTSDLYSSALDFEELNKAVNLLKGDKLCKVLLFMDCCHAGAMSGAKSTFKPIQLVSTNAVQYYSCSAGERSYESTKRPNGIFTAALIDALNGKARDKDRNISTMGLSNYITHTVSAERSDQSPYCDNTQGTFIIF